MAESAQSADDAPEKNWTRRICRGRRGDPCVYCGETPERKAATMDHVFPDALFEPLPDNVLTEPACRPCNDRKAIGDHVLHNYVTFHKDRHRTPDLIDHLKKIARATERRQSPLGETAQQAIAIRKQVDPFGAGGPIPIELGGTADQLSESLGMIVRGLYFANHGTILPASIPVQAKPLTPEQSEEFARVFALSSELWMGKQGGTEWAMFTSPGDPHCVLCLFSIDGVYFVGATGSVFCGDDAE